MKSHSPFVALLALSFLLLAAAHIQAATPDGDAESVKTVKLVVDGMCCAGSLPDIEKSLTTIAGVKSAKATYEPPEATVTFDSTKTTVQALIKAIGKVGFGAKLKDS